jgi:hypothetical protein
MADTTTTTGLSIDAEVDESAFATGIKPIDEELSTVHKKIP